MTADRVTVVTNPSYWRGSVGMDGALFVRYESASALTAAYKAGEIDLIVTEDAAMAETLAAAGAAVNTEPLGRIEHLAFNFAIGGGEGESFRRSVAFRQGIARAIDRDRLADLVGWVSVDGVQRGVIPYSPWSIYDHDVDEARRLVALTCSANGRNCDADPPRLRLIASAFGVRHRIVDQIAADLEEAGIEVEVRLLTSVAMARSVTRRDWDIAVLGISEHAGVAAAADSLFAALDTERDDNVYSYGGDGSLAATDRAAFQLRLLSGKFQESADRDAVNRLLSDAHGLLASDVVFVPLMARPQFTLVNENRLDGVVANATPSGVTWNIGDWVYTDE